MVVSLDRVVPGFVDAHWGYMIDPQYLHMLGPQSLHLVWIPCKQFAPTLAIMDVEVVPARGGGLKSMFPYHLPLPSWSRGTLSVRA